MGQEQAIATLGNPPTPKKNWGPFFLGGGLFLCGGIFATFLSLWKSFCPCGGLICPYGGLFGLPPRSTKFSVGGHNNTILSTITYNNNNNNNKNLYLYSKYTNINYNSLYTTR